MQCLVKSRQFLREFASFTLNSSKYFWLYACSLRRFHCIDRARNRKLVRLCAWSSSFSFQGEPTLPRPVGEPFSRNLPAPGLLRDVEELGPLQYASRTCSDLSGFHDSVYGLGNDSAFPQPIEGPGGRCLRGRCIASHCLLADLVAIGDARSDFHRAPGIHRCFQ